MSTLAEEHELFLSDPEHRSKIVGMLLKAFNEPYSLCGFTYGMIKHRLGEDQDVVDRFMNGDVSKQRSYWMHLCDALSVVIHAGVPINNRDDVKRKLLELFTKDWVIRDKAIDCLLAIASQNDNIILDMAMSHFKNAGDCSTIKCLSSLIQLVHHTIQHAPPRSFIEILLQSINHHKFDVRREAIRTCCNLLFNPQVLHQEAVRDLQMSLSNRIVKLCISGGTIDPNDCVQAEIIEQLPSVLTWMLEHDLLANDTMNRIISIVIQLVYSDADTLTRTACAYVIRYLPLKKQDMIEVINRIVHSKYHIDIRKSALESVVYALSKYSYTDDIISMLIDLLKPDRQNHVYATLKPPSTWELEKISDNDIVFDAFMQLMGKEIPNLPLSPSHLVKDNDPFNKIHQRTKRILTDEHIENISRKSCVEGEYLLLAHFWKTKLK